MITNDIATLIQSSNVSSSTASQLGLENLNGYSIKTTSSTTTRILTISVTGPNAQTAANIANTIVSVTSGISQNVMDVQSVNAIDSAVAPTTPSGPNHLLYTLVALIAGLFVAIAICVRIS